MKSTKLKKVKEIHILCIFSLPPELLLLTLVYTIRFSYYETAYIYYILFCLVCQIAGCMINNGNYLSEISETKYKGMLCSLTVVVAVMGALFVIIQGSFLSYFHINLITTVACGILLVVLLLYIPESPVHLLRKGQEDKSKEMLKWLRCTEDEYVLDRELKILKNSFLNTSQSTRKLSVAEVHSNPYYLKVLIISLVIQTGVSLSGISVVMGYAHDIVERMLSDPNAGQYAIFLLLSQSLGCILNIFLCRKVNRKVCLVTAHTLCSLTLLTVGLLLVGKSLYHIHVPGYVFMSLICGYMFTQGFGISSMVYIILPEIFSVECRNSFTSILMFLHYFCQFITIKLYPLYVNHIQLYGWAFIFSSYSAFIAIFSILYLPESKGRTIQQIFNKLCKTNDIHHIITPRSVNVKNKDTTTL